MYAVIVTGGKQYKVEEGDVIYVEKLPCEDGGEIVFDNVLAVSNGDGLVVGTPSVEGAVVKGEAVKTGRSKKIIVYKMKRRKNYRRKQGHRQPYTKVEIKSISV